MKAEINAISVIKELRSLRKQFSSAKLEMEIVRQKAGVTTPMIVESKPIDTGLISAEKEKLRRLEMEYSGSSGTLSEIQENVVKPGSPEKRVTRADKKVERLAKRKARKQRIAAERKARKKLRKEKRLAKKDKPKDAKGFK